MRLFAANDRRQWPASVLLLAVAACLMLTACGPRQAAQPSSRLEKIRASGVLRVASIYGRTTCYTGPEGLVGYECELAQGIAKQLGATAEVLFTHTPADAVQAVIEGRADIAAAALTASIPQREQLRFTRAVDRSVPQLVFRMGNTRPKSAADLDGRLLVSEGSGHNPQITALSAASPGLKAELTNSFDDEDLLFQVASGDLDYTIASSVLVAINERYYPQIRTAFDVGEPEDVVLAMKRDNDTGLVDAAEGYLSSISGKELARLHDRYYGHVEELDYFSAVQFANHMQSRLPHYLPLFKAAGDRHQIDWRLLAAIGYQESHWNPDATSYTGVRGIMMLTGDTATRYKVSNREDPAQSIAGGARVLSDLLDKIPPEVTEPDRSWMALAAYNQGLGHLLDARELTARRGGDNLRWVDVRDTYPLLARARWANASKYGFARGREAVDFVANVRAYVDLITMLSSGVRTLPPPPLKLDPQLRMADRNAPEIKLSEAAPEEEPIPVPPPTANKSDNILVIPAEAEPAAQRGLRLEMNAPSSMKPAAALEPAPSPRADAESIGHSSN